MKTIFLLFDSLNRRSLAPYGCDTIRCPNFQRLEKRSITFDQCYAGSLPCIPARRDFHTGRLSFPHRSWGPMEPYDQSFIQCLRDRGIYTHLISDHTHYWEEGGGNYHTKYDSWEIVRGQEGDSWAPAIDPCDTSKLLGRKDSARVHDIANRKWLEKSGQYPIDEIGSNTLRFLDENHNKDNWFLHVESFDPHEPFFTHSEFQKGYEDSYTGQEFDWPDYKKADESPEQVEHCINRYRALVTACDDLLGKILDRMDHYSLWDDTALVVTTDHGYLLGEHGWWAKTVQPVYNEISHIPMFWWDPTQRERGWHSSQLVQTYDIAPTFLEAYGIPVPKVMTGKSIDLTAADGAQRDKKHCLFGIHGCHLNITDGRYVYMRRPREKQLNEYTLMPCNMKRAFPIEMMEKATLHPPFDFTCGCPVLQLPTGPWADIDFEEYGDMLFDLESDPDQMHPVEFPEVTERLCAMMCETFKEHDAPAEAYTYWGLERTE